MPRSLVFRGLLGISLAWLACLTPKINCCDNKSTQYQSGISESPKIDLKPTCNPQCGLNSICIQPNVCECKSGYSDSHGVCMPRCTDGCGEHGKCAAPNKCVCVTGYEWNQMISKCTPKCEPKCGQHSYCEMPNHCKCQSGFDPIDLLSLSCTLSYQWWVFCLIGIFIVLILCSAAGIIFYFKTRSRDISYYPNSTPSDTTIIVQ